MPLNAGAWVARDDADRWHFLVEAPTQSGSLARFATKALDVGIREFRIGGRASASYVDLCCLETVYWKTFAAVASDIASAIERSPENSHSAVVESLERWRSFWAVDPSGLSRQEALGLFGELWFMLRWMGPVTRTVIERWRGPLEARHDFQWELASIEVKTGIASFRGVVHEISSLEQLEDPETGSLYLFSIRVADDALGANTLPVLVERVFADIANDEDCRRLFAARLARAGYSPVHAERYQRKLRVIREELYRVEGSFPRLTRSGFPGGLPTGIEGVSYALDLAACAPWRTATSPSERSASFLRD